MCLVQQINVRHSNLEDEQSQEVDVGNSLELLVQVQREEGEHVVLVRLDGVALKTRGRERSLRQTKTKLVQILPL